MGYSLASAVYATWSHLPDRPFRLLVHMALSAKDSDAKPRYFGGRVAMVLALGMDPEKRTARQMASRAATVLAESGAITRIEGTGYRGVRQEYWLHAYRVTTESPKATTAEAPAKTKGDSTVDKRVIPESTKGDSTVAERVTPQSPQELLTRHHSETDKELSSSQVSTDRATEVEPKRISLSEAQKILDDASRRGVDVVTVMRSAPQECTTKAQRRAWAAQQIAEEAS